jgi:excisionase family DNA binding protein
MEKILYSKKEAAGLLSISLRSVENLISAKKLDSRRIGRRRLITRTSLEKLARRDVSSASLRSTEPSSTASNIGAVSQP